MKQSTIFLNGEAAAWRERNKDKLAVKNYDDDPIVRVIGSQKLPADRVLEIGCGDGGRLMHLRSRGSSVCGIDPAPIRHDFVYRGTADNLPFFTPFDLVIYGFCLYLCDREDLFKIASEGDRVLKPGGHIVIWDFASHVPENVPYKHCPGVTSYKMDYTTMWKWNSIYRYVYARRFTNGGEATKVSVLQKRQ